MLHAIHIVWAHTAQNITLNGYLLRDSKHGGKILKQMFENSFKSTEFQRDGTLSILWGWLCVCTPQKHADRWKKRTYVVLLTDVGIFRSIMHSKEAMNGKKM